MNKVIAIDPGTRESAFLVWDGSKIIHYGDRRNEDMLVCIDNLRSEGDLLMAVEMVASYGMAVGREVFETCVWVGRFIQQFHPGQHRLVYRKDVKIHHCQSMRATDSNIRQALIDKYGEQGNKKAPGLTYPLRKHLWSAFAIATFITESMREVEQATPFALKG